MYSNNQEDRQKQKQRDLARKKARSDKRNWE